MTQQTEAIVVAPMSSPADARAFKDLNMEWIEKFFSVEPADLATLDHPEKIVDGGGEVLIARIDGEAVGCVALVQEHPGVFELSKMAVSPRFQGRGIGRVILTEAIERVRGLGAKELFLASNARLAPAVHLYESIGFTHVPPSELPPSPYDRADVFMRYPL
ncbi:GNAT family N-acetyltransferase [Nocardia sp. CDC153]|uniref:GNAT family N-acetyltransferase n=1 Tax=Nocardia sp. CDC153 TaxID=3112167 RepID=UPI002DBB433B|nr:GNAT family N-acetyltransferase [Nocardia sp. CDC153]MEC3952150.1 GNAT family N-acetyltransferase [Nocardia sp. CDC153]